MRELLGRRELCDGPSLVRGCSFRTVRCGGYESFVGVVVVIFVAVVESGRSLRWVLCRRIGQCFSNGDL